MRELCAQLISHQTGSRLHVEHSMDLLVFLISLTRITRRYSDLTLMKSWPWTSIDKR